MGTIVVGVDGSEGSWDALRWALDEARLRQATLRAVHAWTFPSLSGVPGFAPAIDADLLHELREAGEGILEHALSEAGAEAAGFLVERVVVEGSAARVLVEAAVDADLLVVGTRGHGGFRGLLLGSVSQQCAHHARCPVVIVPPRRGSGEPGEGG